MLDIDLKIIVLERYKLNKATNAAVVAYCRVGECIHVRGVSTFSIDSSIVAHTFIISVKLCFRNSFLIGVTCRDMKSMLFLAYSLIFYRER